MHPRTILTMFALAGTAATSLTAQTDGIREVSATSRTVIPLHTKLRYTTMVLLPDDEEILDVVCGDKDFWVISATQHIAHIKPAKAGAATNLNLVTSTGAVYSFLLSEDKGTSPDLKVYVTADPDVARPKPRFIPASQVSLLEAELSEVRSTADAAQRRGDDAIAAFTRQYPSTLQFPYGTPKYEKPFLVRSIWHDGQFTYITSDAREMPVLYEVADGRPALVDFQVRGKTYVVPKVLERGYLALGKARFAFQQGR